MIPPHDPVGKAEAAWGIPLPDWIEALARDCAATSQKRVGVKIGLSNTVVSQVLGRTYKGDLAGVEERTRGVYLNGRIACHALGGLPTNECLDWQKKARVFHAGNPLRTRMYRACRSCARFTDGEEEPKE